MEEQEKVEQEVVEQPAEQKDPEVKREDLQAVMARLDEMAKDLAELRLRQEEMEDEEDYEEIAY